MSLSYQIVPDRTERLGPQAMVLRGFAASHGVVLLAAVDAITAGAPWRHMQTPAGAMSVAMSNCGDYGWVSDRQGYRYSPVDPQSGQPWPAMPLLFSELAGEAALAVGFADFRPDACLINRYAENARMGLHQDKDEQDMSHPIVSVSLGLPAVFQFGGHKRSEPVQRVLLEHGDVVVWGGADRLRYHGIQPLKPGLHALTGPYRFNLTFRKAC